MDTRTNHYFKLLPGRFELWCLALVTLALLAAGNAKLFLQRYGLIDSSALVRTQLSDKVGNGLHALDTLTFTPQLVTFIWWAAVGLVLFAVAQAFLRAYRTLQYEREFESNQYLHPQGFTSRQYWRQIVTSTVLSFTLTALAAVSSMLYLFVLLPTSLQYVRQFLLRVSFGHIVPLLLGSLLLFAGTVALYTLIKLAVRQHRYRH